MEYFRAHSAAKQAWELLTEWTQSESLRKHALAVETCVAACGDAEADRLGLAGDEREAFLELYATTALLHDFDYERHPSPEEHPFVGVRELERLGWPQALRTAILGHAQYSGRPARHPSRQSALRLRRAGRISDRLRAGQADQGRSPTSRSPSVRKKMKDKAFARGVNREDVIQGAAELGVELDAHIGFCIEAMKKRSSEIGL